MLLVTSWPETVEAAATCIGSIGVVCALIYTARQTRVIGEQARLQNAEAERNIDVQRGGLELRLMELTISIDRIFLERPSLRSYIYENRPLRWCTPPRRRAEVVTVAEIMIDFVDTIAGLRRHGQISDRNYENWRIFTESYYQQSPAIRELWEHWGEFFLPETSELLTERDGPTELHTEISAPAHKHLVDALRPAFPRFMPPGRQSPERDSNS